MKNLGRRLLVLGVITLACPVVILPASAQIATAPELKAAFLLNFLKFTNWPEGVAPTGAALTICVLGDNRVVLELGELTRGQKIDGRDSVVAILRDRDSVQRCHLLYASGLRADQEQALVDATRGRPILTASDSITFIRRGGIAGFYVANGRMKFAVNPAAAERSQLRISSKLLNVAVIVKDGEDAKIR